MFKFMRLGHPIVRSIGVERWASFTVALSFLGLLRKSILKLLIKKLALLCDYFENFFTSH